SDSWEPGAEYVLTVVLRSEEMGAAGFQLSARTADGRPAGRFAALDDRVAVDESADRELPTAYARHTRAGSRVDDPSITAWRVLWTAPPHATEVRFHGAANSGNGDNSPFGDLVYTTAFAVRAVGTAR
ncbi:MAG: choice-of-anchor V domain-containing protein, partial [Longimicrobiales bacterium]